MTADASQPEGAPERADSPAGNAEAEKVSSSPIQSPTEARTDDQTGAGSAQTKALRESLLRDSLLIVRIDGMHSHACEDRIVGSVSALPGVKEVEVDFASGQASIIFDARKVPAHQLLEAVEQAGYRCGDYALGSGGGTVE